MPSATRRPAVFRRSVHDVKDESAIAQRRNNQPTGLERRVGLIVAAPAEGDEAIEVKIGAAARAFDNMVDVKLATPPARLAAPTGAAAHLALNRLPFNPRGGRTTGGACGVG